MVHAATRSCRKRPCANPVASPATARMGAPHARTLGTLTRNGKYAAISTGAEKPIRAVLRKAVSDAPAKTANRIQCDSLTFLHERTSTSAAAMAGPPFDQVRSHRAPMISEDRGHHSEPVGVDPGTSNRTGRHQPKPPAVPRPWRARRSEEHTSELQSLRQ